MIIESTIDNWAIYRISLIFLGWILLIFQILKKNSSFVIGANGLFPWLLMWGFYNLVTTLWSINPLWTAYKSIEVLLPILLSVHILNNINCQNSLRKFFNWNWLIVGLNLVFLLINLFFLPNLSIIQSNGLINFQVTSAYPLIPANGVGEYSATLAIILISRLMHEKKHKFFYSVIILLSILLLIISQTRSAIIGFALGIIFLFIFRKKYFQLLVSIFIILLASLTSFSNFFSRFFLRGQNENDLLSFTGRLRWWEPAYYKFLEKPIGGFGSYAAGRFMIIDPNDFSSSLHNTWIELLISSGFLGFIFLLIIFFLVWLIFVKSNKKVEKTPVIKLLLSESIGVLGLLSVRSLFSSQFLWPNSLTWFLLVLFAEYLRRNYWSKLIR
jgi:O-antigen ligase